VFEFGKSGRKHLTLVTVVFIFIVAVATIFYRFMEGWSWIDSFYFSSITILTIGHSQLIPSSDVAKVFTVILSFFGISTFLILVGLLAGDILKRES